MKAKLDRILKTVIKEYIHGVSSTKKIHMSTQLFFWVTEPLGLPIYLIEYIWIMGLKIQESKNIVKRSNEWRILRLCKIFFKNTNC